MKISILMPGALPDAMHDRGIVGLVRRAETFENGGFQCGRFVELLPFQNPQGLAEDVCFIRVTTRADEAFDELIQRWRQGDGHGMTLVGSGQLGKLNSEV